MNEFRQSEGPRCDYGYCEHTDHDPDSDLPSCWHGKYERCVNC